MTTPKALLTLEQQLERLPGIGSRKAQELAQHLALAPADSVHRLAQAIVEANARATVCQDCRADTDQDRCPICLDTTRNPRQICVVANTMDLSVVEAMGIYRGRYHVLRGELDPARGVSPSKLEVESLLRRIEPLGHDPTAELILATNHTLNGEITAQLVIECVRRAGFTLPVSRIASGVARGQNVSYADPITLSRALSARDVWIPQNEDV